MLIIGCGNRERGDDRAGVVVAERLQKLGIEAKIHTGDALALIELWSGKENVILIDAVVTGAPSGTVHNWRVDQLPSAAGSSASTHGLDVVQAIALAQTLERLPKNLRFYGIEGSCFGIGEEMSRDVSVAVEKAVREIATEAASEISSGVRGCVT